MLDEYLKSNLAWWDEAAELHPATALYDVDGFKRGAESLTTIERDELGPLVAEGTTLLHLQCHLGLDTLSWARRGATVTGVDFSGKAVEAARRLADDVGLARRARFIQSNVYDLPARARGPVRRRVQFLGRAHLARRPRALGRRRRALRSTRRGLLPGRVPPRLLPHRRRGTPRRAAPHPPVLPGAGAAPLGRARLVRRPAGGHAGDRHLRVAARPRRDRHPPAATRAAASTSCTSSPARTASRAPFWSAATTAGSTSRADATTSRSASV